MKRKADRSRGETAEYKEGDLVWVDGSNTASPDQKVSPISDNQEGWVLSI